MRPRPYKFPIGISRFRRDARAARSVDKDHPVKEEEEVHGSRPLRLWVGAASRSHARLLPIHITDLNLVSKDLNFWMLMLFVHRVE